MEVLSYRDLKVWQLGMSLVRDVYKVTRRFPKAEMFALTSQLQRAAVSVPSNIAEGHARRSTRDFLHFLNISLGSLAEMETQLLIAQDLGYVDQGVVELLLVRSDELGKMMRALHKSLEKKQG